MRPSRRLVVGLALWSALGLVPAVWPQALAVWAVLGALLLLAAVLDFFLSPPRLRAERHTETILPVGVWRTVRLRLHNDGRRAQDLSVFDHYPQPADYDDLPQSLILEPGAWAECRYRLCPLLRGELRFGPVQALAATPLRLWRRSLMLGQSQTVRVYPNFANIAKYALLALDNRVAAMGIHQRRRRGEGQDFFQLREYREGDPLRQIDWKATARHRKLISKEYQDERDQRVVFLLDCSRRMRAQDGLLSHFDHALNALILLAYVALRQGDAVGVHSFGGARRWLVAKKGKNRLSHVIDAVYDLQPTLSPPDYASAADALMARQRRRALVVVLSNLRDEDGGDLLPALRLLRQRHLVLVASLREQSLDTTLQQTVDDFPQARLYAATCHYLAQRERSHEALRRQGAVVLDSLPEALPVALVNDYFDIKRSGRL